MSPATPPGMTHVHHQPVAEGGVGGGAEGFAVPGEAGIEEGEAGIAGDGADIGGMVGDALELGHDGAQIIARGAGISKPSAASAAWAKARLWATVASPEMRAAKRAARRGDLPRISASVPLWE